MFDKFKKIFIPFILIIVFNLGIYYLTIGRNFGGGYSPHVGILLISGLLLGPYGVLGAVVGNFLCDLIRGYIFSVSCISAIVGFVISYLSYKLWYNGFNDKIKVIKPNLNSTSHFILFVIIIFICGAIYSIIHAKLFYLFYSNLLLSNLKIELHYFVNFINSSFIFGIIGIWLSKHFDFYHSPKKSEKGRNPKLYFILGILLVVCIILTLIFDILFGLTNEIIIVELIMLMGLLFAYITKPFTSDIENINSISISESIMDRFLIISLILIFFSILISYDSILIRIVNTYSWLDLQDVAISILLLTDLILLIFLIPSIHVLRYSEKKLIKPITNFSKIENFVKENQKIESEGLLNIYSMYTDNDDEIGVLARSYSDLININNNYIENIQKIEGEKERIKAELDIATKIQQSNLPLEPIENEKFIVDGYSKPAKEVGGDFFDYYELDDGKLAIVIGDASGKGVPAALLATITQVIIKLSLKHENDPSKILFSLNNQLCENNSEVMFITLWLGIYDKTTCNLTFANAGHNPPLVKHGDKFEFLNVDEGIVLGIMDDFEFKKEEFVLNQGIVAYTDGITDANNASEDMYGEDGLINFFNNNGIANDPIVPLLDDINKFVDGEEQFDDMTIVYLKIKDD